MPKWAKTCFQNWAKTWSSSKDSFCSMTSLTFEPPRGKTNNVVYEQVSHKPACSSIEKS